MVAINLLPSYSLSTWKVFWNSVDAGEVIWGQDTSGFVTKMYNITALGTTVIVDREGQVTYRDNGATSYDTLKREVERVL